MNKLTRFVYKYLIKPILFKIDPEYVHNICTRIGEYIGGKNFLKKITSEIYGKSNYKLKQNIFGINFNSPVGLAAGFDYEARLTQVIPALGFGFETVGTITNLPYEGNEKPRLGRLPKSKSLLVNKGFKNLGIQKTLDYLKNKNFEFPVGLSIGKTNTSNHIRQKDGVEDVVSAFKIAESFNLPFAYYELNISCPNLQGNIEFYEPEHLEELLVSLASLNIQKPVFIKMPISKTDEEIRMMMDVINKFNFIKAVIIGNLQRDRKNEKLLSDEVDKFNKGNFSGLPCLQRSDELISFVYKNYGEKIKIIGCGGIFSAEDAYRKIKLGASLVQLITGMIYEGPQLISEINRDLVRLLDRDNISNISEAIGKDQ